MPKSITIPFYAVKLHLSTGGELTVPLMDSDALQINETLPKLAQKYAAAFQQKVLNEGNYGKLINEYREGDFLKDSVAVAFPKSKDENRFPSFILEFDYLYNAIGTGFWGVVSTLGVEVFSENLADLKNQIVEAIQLEFTRKRRLTAVHAIVSAIWFEDIELLQQDINLTIHTLAELENLNEQEKKAWLPQIAEKLEINQKVMFGREVELLQLSRILKSNFGKNALLVGPTGVGKTVLLWELARQKNKLGIERNIWETTASILIKELTKNTGWQDNLVFLCKELAKTGDILFVRNLVELFEVGKYEGNSVSIAEYLRPFVSRGEITLVSECTDTELAHIEAQSPNYSSFFQIIRLEEPRDDLEEIILEKVKKVAQSRSVNIDNQAITEVVRLNRRFTPYAGFPGKPIRFLESIIINNSPAKLTKKEVKKGVVLPPSTISKQEVIRYFCEESGMPSFMVDDEIPMDLQAIKTDFNNQVFGQDKAVDSVADILAAVKTAMTRTGKPIASFLFVGPTGVGKTELAKVLAKFMFGRRDRMIRFDMSEFSQPYSVLRLTGVGKADGLLTSAVRREPFSVLLFDEIEKADSSFYDLLLQILSEGRLTDGQGKLVNFCSAIIIMTSNIGAANLQSNRIGWKKTLDANDVTTHFKSAVEKHFRPELFNRIDQIIPFEPLDEDTIRFVMEREMELFKKLEGIQFRNLDLEIKEEVLDLLGKKGYNPKYGARQLQRTIREELMTPLSKALNLYDFDDCLSVTISVDNDEVKIDLEEDIFGGDLLLEQWDKINFADKASELRRKIFKLKEGSFYIQLLSKMDLMESEKRYQGENFWTDQKRANLYSYYLSTKSKVDTLTKTIEDYERTLSLACMGLETYTTDNEELLKTWEDDFFNLKVEIYNRLYPGTATAFLSIYGANFEQILDFYLVIIEKKGFEVTGKTVWFRESFYNEEIMEGVLSADEESQEILIKKRHEYIKKEWNDANKHHFKPEESTDRLVGIELEIKGLCAFPFFKNESGLQQWEVVNDSPNIFDVHFTNGRKKTPKGIHRRKYFQKGSPRRFVELKMVKDPKLRIGHPIPKEGLEAWFFGILEQEFRMLIAGEVV